jgi:hypothetical protein
MVNDAVNGGCARRDHGPFRRWLPAIRGCTGGQRC